MNLRPVMHVLGLIVCFMAMAMLVPAIVDLADSNDDWRSFFLSAMVTGFFGGLLLLSCYDDKPSHIGVRESFVLTTLAWVVVAGVSALPLLGVGLDYSDAFFEAMSGVTTTGSTALTDLDSLPRGILLWRAMLNGIGGLGIVVMAIILLPFLRVGGMQLFQSESSEKSEKILARTEQLVISTALIYVALMSACALTYLLLGMGPFDAICHAMATVATGGFSTHDASFAFFRSASIETAAIIFMISGALPFVVMIKALKNGPDALINDEQVRGFIAFIVLVSIVLACWLAIARELPPLDALRLAAFNVTSIITTTGFASDDYSAWGAFSVGVFFLLTFVGGCSGSTSGAIKIYRLQVAGLLVRTHFVHLISPHRVVPLYYNSRRLPDDVSFSVVSFLAIYLATVGIFTVLLAATGLDLITSLSSAAQAIGNVGPGLGDTVGPAGNFATLPDTAKWILSLAMLLGRLELFTVLVLFQTEFWQD